MKKIIGSFLALLILASFSVHANASEKDDLFIQVDLNGGPNGECSIMKSKPDGTISEFVSNSQILSTTGLTSADCDDTGLAVGLNGRVYFSEDDSDNILVANPNGTVSTFVTDTVVNMLFPMSVDWDYGMAINPVTGTLVAADEDNEAIIEFPTDVPTPITDTALINILATEADFLALVTNVDLEGGIAIDPQGNIYITNDDSGNDVDHVIFKLTSAGDLSILCTQAQLTAVTGTTNMDLDVGMAFSGNLFVGDDGGCNCILEIDPVTCDPQILITEAQIIALTGGTSVDLEGGVCIDTNMNLFIEEDGEGNSGDDEPNIIKVPISSPHLASIFVSQAEIDNLYATISPGGDPQLEGSCGVKQVDTEVGIPTISEWGLIAMAGVLGIVGFMVIRRRMVKA
ncbi:MAG: IPTL-CTERM sorting domain-containing protein [Candidatus Dadabacteria bacterium]|nr:IPTL-CTERM sorting domain-containing protein [Candidatus Dadabacteria bacterium]